ncbi:hypothetical protein MVEN_01253200 [Mycena venus]|uniref:Uncharacterized protein n=1 Tax=Mycena venus TaxID=2733690 RepID=A0A8H6Y576_9AGAR|nr:hypothetical protein MVEN_01253200 [Mycena venus]
MHLFNLFKTFGPKSSPQGIQSEGETEIAIPSPELSNGSSRKRRRLKRRAAKQSATGWQPEETRSLSGIRIPEARNEGFRSAPNLLSEHQVQDNQSRSWSPIATLERRSAATAPYEPSRDNQFPENVDTPIYGPREQGLFRNEMPYDMVQESPLTQLASGWRESPRYIPRRLPTPPVRSSQEVLHRNEMLYDMACTHSKDLPQRRDSPEARSTYRTFSPEPFRRHDSGSRHSSDMASPYSKEIPSEWRHSPEARPPHRSVSPEPYRPRDSRSQHSSHTVDGTYYIVPGGVDVIFQDEDGNEITRVGDFSGRRKRVSPIIVQDEDGRELYRTSETSTERGESSRRGSRRARDDEEVGHRRSGRLDRSHRSELSDSDRSRSRSELPTIVLIDRSGRQIPIMPFVSDRRSE